MRILGAILLSLPLCTFAQVGNSNCVKPQAKKMGNCAQPIPIKSVDGSPLPPDNFRFNVGVKAGPTVDMHKIKGDVAIPGSDASAGFNVGVFTRFRTGWFSVQPEVMYSRSAHEYSVGTISNPQLETPAPLGDAALHKIDIPVMAQFHIGQNFRLGVGPQYTARIQKINTKAGDQRAWANAETDLKKSLFNIRTGMGADFGRLTLDLTYDVNLNDYGFSNFPVGGTTVAMTDRIHSLVFSVGVKFLQEDFFP